MSDTTSKKSTASAPTEKQAEKANVAVEILKPRTKIRRAICGKGRCSFPLTKSEAQDLEGMGLVRIIGIF